MATRKIKNVNLPYIKHTSPLVEDANELFTEGLYNATPSVTKNIPPGGAGIVLLVMNYLKDPLFTQQISFDLGAAAIWYRRYNEATKSWRSWKQLHSDL